MDRVQMDSRNGRRIRLVAGFALCCVLGTASGLLVRLFGQQQTIPTQQTMPGITNNKSSHNPFDGFPEPDQSMAQRQMRALNAMRQKSMVSDTEKLLKLAQELNKEIESSNSTALTPVQLRKIADIEKLARNVKQKMSISYSGSPAFEEPISR